MINRWIYQDLRDNGSVEELSESLDMPQIVSRILHQRGISSPAEVETFFNPSLNDLHDPFGMKGMRIGIDRINEAIKKNQKILIYGDYDVDGTTSVALVYGFIKHIHSNIDYYIPDRYHEGYGVSEKGIQWAIDQGFSLIITLDCGIKAIETSQMAFDHGIDMIICDHHLPGEELPNAVAIIDPKQQDCAYPYKELSGCGIGFKLIQAFCISNDYDPDFLYDYLDLVTISIASDIVPVTGENRILSHFGLKKLNNDPRPGVQALIEKSNIKGDINITSIVFGIGPRINASGRMDHAKSAVELLLSADIRSALSIADSLDDQNAERRNFDHSITTEAMEMIERSENLKSAKSTVLFKNDWHKGVIGIVASRCLDKYYRPTIILTESNGKATGSARSVAGFNVHEAIAECSDLLDQYGGHMYAAGLTMELGNIENFKEKFEKVVSSNISDDMLVPQIEIDAILDFEVIDYKFFNYLIQMAPFGPGNMQPVFVTHDLKISGYAKVLKEQHLKFTVKQGENTAHEFEAIAFGMAEYADLVGSGMPFSMAYYLEENTFMGNSTLQLRVKDLKFD